MLEAAKDVGRRAKKLRPTQEEKEKEKEAKKSPSPKARERSPGGGVSSGSNLDGEPCISGGYRRLGHRWLWSSH